MTARHAARLIEVHPDHPAQVWCYVSRGAYGHCVLDPGHEGRHSNLYGQRFDLVEGASGMLTGDTVVPLGSILMTYEGRRCHVTLNPNVRHDYKWEVWVDGIHVPVHAVETPRIAYSIISQIGGVL